MRLDSTVTAALMHEPSDSSLLWDAVRVMVRLLQQADALAGGTGARLARSSPGGQEALAAPSSSPAAGRKRVQLYRELIKLTRATLAYLRRRGGASWPRRRSPAAALWQAKVGHYRPLIERIIAQSERRVLAGEAVPAGDKLVSLFEPHADIIVKGSRDVDYGHKLNLTTGRSGLILDLVIEAGNPADSERFLPMLERHIAHLRRRAAAGGRRRRLCQPRQSRARPRPAASATWPSTRRAACRIEDMVRSRWVYRKLRNFRAGIEAGISCLKRAYGWPAAPGAGSTTSRPMSGPRSWPTTSRSSPASDQPEVVFGECTSLTGGRRTHRSCPKRPATRHSFSAVRLPAQNHRKCTAVFMQDAQSFSSKVHTHFHESAHSGSGSADAREG